MVHCRNILIERLIYGIDVLLYRLVDRVNLAINFLIDSRNGIINILINDRNLISDIIADSIGCFRQRVMRLLDISLNFFPRRRLFDGISQLVVIRTDIIAGHTLYPAGPGAFITETVHNSRPVPEHGRNLQPHLLVRFARIRDIRERHRSVAVRVWTVLQLGFLSISGTGRELPVQLHTMQ